MPPYSDHPYTLYSCATIIIFVTTLIVKYIIEKSFVHQEIGRKLLHFVAIMTCAYVVYFTREKYELAWIFLIFSAILLYIAHQNILLPSKRKSYGIAIFPLAFSLLLFSGISSDAVLFGMITLGISDALAGIAGEHFAKEKHIFLFEQKSWLGFSAFYVSTLMIGYAFIGFSSTLIILALVPALSELFSVRGSDNLSVPIISSMWLLIIRANQYNSVHWFAFFAMLLLLFLVYKKNWLTAQGTAAALLLGTLIIFSTGPVYLIPIALFFIIGSLSSRLHPKSGDALGRNAFQVFANGSVAVITLILFSITKNEIFFIASLVSVAVSLSDTLSSDIGTYFKNKTYDITTFRPVKPGISGGVSISGTLAGILGALIFSWFVGIMFDLQVNDRLIILLSGIAGMILDSFIGSVWQAKYLVKSEIVEEKTDESRIIKGQAWLNNDGVNFISNFLIVVALTSMQYFSHGF